MQQIEGMLLDRLGGVVLDSFTLPADASHFAIPAEANNGRSKEIDERIDLRMKLFHMKNYLLNMLRIAHVSEEKQAVMEGILEA